ncbi:Regulator of nonsense transcripts 1-like protein [Lobaria immixta]|nr:Regulator of nonsense transcripts 1-like protein [Lobaria immixta]
MTDCNRFGGGLYQAQEEAVQMALQFKVPNVFGPAAARKSYTLATLVFFLAFTGQKVVVSLPTNVGIDSLLSKVYAEAPKFGFKGDLNFVRTRPHMVATTNPGRYPGYLQGLHELEQQGTVTAKGDQKKYDADAAKLIKEILKSAKVVLCTNAFLRSSALGPKAGDTRMVVGATTVIMDEAGCANSGGVIMPVITFASTLRRFVLAEDPPSDETELPNGIAKLTIPFRTHSDAFDPVNHVVYENKVESVIQTTQPPEALKNLLASFPLLFTVGSSTFTIATFINFIDVHNGKEHTSPKGSSSNGKEVDTVRTFVRALLKKMGKMASDIFVMSGYSFQAKTLGERAQADNWSRAKVCTVDSTQGQEWDIVILSPVKTQGDPSFIGTRNRANVACSGHKSALCLVGKWQFWNVTHSSGNKYMDLLLRQMVYSSGPNSTKRPHRLLALTHSR